MFPDDAPTPEELEISVFGAGTGECIVAHIGDAKWIVIDSLKQAGSEAVALEYFKSINVDPAKAIVMIVATHWHDDHIRGISEIFNRAAQAKFAMGQALSSQEYIELVSHSTLRETTLKSSLRELRTVAETSQRRTGATGESRLSFAAVAKTLFIDQIGTSSIPVKVEALSPSDESIRQALKEFSKLIPTVDSPNGIVVDSKPNHYCVVLRLSIGRISCLFGADLENHALPTMGWKGLVANYRALVGGPPSCLYKVAHHGSQNADSPDIWTQLLQADPIALVTPFSRSKLPRNEDLARITRQSSKVHLASQPQAKLAKYDPTVERTLREMKLKPRAVGGQLGHIRCRLNLADPLGVWRVSHHGAAQQVN